MSFNLNFHIFLDHSPAQQRIPLQESVNYRGRTYQLYEINETLSKGLLENAAAAAAAQPKKIRAIFLNEPCPYKRIILGKDDSLIEHRGDIERKASVRAIQSDAYDWKTDYAKVAQSKELMLKAIEHNPANFKHAHPDLKKDKKIVLTAMAYQNRKTTRMIEMHYQKGQSDANWWELNCTSPLWVLQDADPILLQDKEFMVAALQQSILKPLPQNLYQGGAIKKMMLKHQEDHPLAENMAFMTDGQNRQLVERILAISPSEVKQAVALAAVQQDASFLLHIPPNLLSKDFVQTAIECNVAVFDYIPVNSALKNDPDIKLAAIPQADSRQAIPSTIDLSSKNFALAAVKKNWRVFSKILPSLRNDKEIVLAATEQNAEIFWTAPHLYEHADIIREAIKRNWKVLHYQLAAPFWQDRKIALEAIRQSSEAFYYLPQNFQQDKEILHDMFEQHPFLKSNPLFIQTVCTVNPRALLYADENLRQNQKFVETSIKSNFHAFEYAPLHLRKDKAFIKKVLSYHDGGESFDYAHKDLKRDKAFVAGIVQENGYAFAYVPAALRNDPELMLIAAHHIVNNYRPECITWNLASHKEFILLVARSQPEILNRVIPEMINDVVLAHLKCNENNAQHIPPHLLENQEFMLAAATYDINHLHHLSNQLKHDKNFLLEMIRLDGRALFFAIDAFKQDQQLVQAAHQCMLERLGVLKENPSKYELIYYVFSILSCADKLLLPLGHPVLEAARNLFQDKAIALQALQMGGEYVQYFDPNLLLDKDFILEAIAINFSIFKVIPPSLLQDKAFILAAIEKEPQVFAFLPLEMKTNIEILRHGHQALIDRLVTLRQDPSKKDQVLSYTAFVTQLAGAFSLHAEHPIMQEFIQAYTIAVSTEDPKNPYQIHARLAQAIQEEPLFDEFVFVRKRATTKNYTFNDIPEGIIPLADLFMSIEQRGIKQKELDELCQTYYGIELPEQQPNEAEVQFEQRVLHYRTQIEQLRVAYLRDIQTNILGQGKLIPILLAQKGEKEDPLSLTNMYLRLILKRISDEDNTRKDGQLSDRENMLLKFASMVKECETGQADAIEQYYLHVINVEVLDKVDSTTEKIDKTVDGAVQLALLEILSSESLIQDLTEEQEVKQMSHQTLYLKNRYHKQLGLHHSLSFDFNAGVVYEKLEKLNPHLVLVAVKSYFYSLIGSKAKEVLDRTLLTKKGISYVEFIDYFEKQFGLKDNYADFIEFNEELEPIGIKPIAVKKILQKLDYLPAEAASSPSI
jgi:hypothetical protein